MVLTVKRDLSQRQVADELFVLDRTNSRIHTFNRTGKVLWERIVNGATEEELIVELTDRFEVAPDEARADVADFVGLLNKAELLDGV